jgi:exopolyphosphatase/guanosine-5'-triphosphate,3'-diphosphate pyrophosphatase
VFVSAPPGPLEHEITQLIAEFPVSIPDPEHAERCARFAASLFDALGALLQLDLHDRRLAVTAALLHDVGYVRAGRDHHRKSYDVIMGSSLSRVSRQDQVIVACAARYHGRTMPNIEHAGFGELGYLDQRRVRRIAAIVRVAAALDASHLGLIEGVRARVAGTTPSITAVASGEPSVERDRLREAAAGFESLTGFPLRVEIEVMRQRTHECED